MANAPSKFVSEGGRKFSGKAAVAIAQNEAVIHDSSGTLILATANAKIDGISINNYAAGETCTYHKGGRSTVLCASAATVAAGDLVLISSTAGSAGPDGTSGSTANSVNTIGRVKTSKDSDNIAYVEWF